jgi:hypothetical protein
MSSHWKVAAVMTRLAQARILTNTQGIRANIADADRPAQIGNTKVFSKRKIIEDTITSQAQSW